MSMRFMVAAVLLCWFFPLPKGQFRVLFLAALVGATLQYGLTFYGLAGLDASTAVLFMQLEVPFSAALAAIFLNDKLGWQRTCGMVVAFLGVALIAGAPSLENQLLPAFLVIAGVFTWAVGQVIPFLLLLPVVSILGAVLFLGERPSMRVLLGGVVVIMGVATIIMFGQSKASDQADTIE